MLDFTTEELRTLVWMCQNQAAQVCMRGLKKGRKPEEDPVYNRILEISKKAYSELVAGSTEIRG